MTGAELFGLFSHFLVLSLWAGRQKVVVPA